MRLLKGADGEGDGEEAAHHVILPALGVEVLKIPVHLGTTGGLMYQMGYQEGSGVDEMGAGMVL